MISWLEGYGHQSFMLILIYEVLLFLIVGVALLTPIILYFKFVDLITEVKPLQQREDDVDVL